MELINPTDTEFVDRIKDLEKKVENLSNRTQAPFIEWLSFQEELEYVSSTTIQRTNSNIDLTKYFTVGDKFRYKQGSEFKYGYVTGVNSTTLRVNGGTDYEFANLTITDVAKGVTNLPTGFPYTFNFDPDFRTLGTTLSSLDNETYLFWMTGTVMYVDLHFSTATLSGNNSSIVCDLPEPADNVLGVPFIPFVAKNYFPPAAGGIVQTGGVKLGSSISFDAEFQVIEYTGSSATGLQVWFAATNFIGLDATFSYIIETTI